MPTNDAPPSGARTPRDLASDPHIVAAIQAHDASALTALLVHRTGEPIMMPTPGIDPHSMPPGSYAGWCARVRWADGIRILADAGLELSANAAVCNPWMWAFHHDDVALATALRDSRVSPMARFIDDRLHGIPASIVREGVAALQQLAADATAGSLDRAAARAHVEAGQDAMVIPSVAALLLNWSRQDSHRVWEAIIGMGITRSALVDTYLHIGIAGALRDDRPDVAEQLAAVLAPTLFDPDIADGRVSGVAGLKAFTMLAGRPLVAPAAITATHH